jgi:hypothetical protein
MANSISFMPYFPNVHVNKTYGHFRVWNWHKHKTEYTSDMLVLAFLERYFAVYVRSDGKPEQRITILEDLIPPSTSANGVPIGISRFSHLMMLGFLITMPVNPEDGFFACTSDNFTAYHQVFDPQRFTASVDFGSYMQTQWIGSPLEKLKLLTPQYVPDQASGVSNERFIEYLASVCDLQSLEVERLFRSLHWVQFAFSNVPGYLDASRHVAMATAFEILLDLPEKGKAREFSERVNNLISPNNLPTSTRQLLFFGQLKPVTENVVGWWCREFYDLRSRIVHGDEIRTSDYSMNGIQHLKLALYLFCDCVQGLLVKWGIVTPYDRSFLFWFGQQWVDALKIDHNDFVSPQGP